MIPRSSARSSVRSWAALAPELLWPIWGPALAIAAFFLTLFGLKGLHYLYTRLAGPRAARSGTGRRILSYGYQAMTVVASVMAALMVLYVVGDILLLALALELDGRAEIEAALVVEQAEAPAFVGRLERQRRALAPPVDYHQRVDP